MHFSIDEPPPVNIGPSELLTRTVDILPARLRCYAQDFVADCTSRNACSLLTNAFWYVFCALRQPGSERTQLHLLRLMAQHVARLSLSLRCNKDTFFNHFPPLLAHAVILGLRRHKALPVPGQAHARAILQHIVSLMGGLVPSDLMAEHIKHAERAHSMHGDLESKQGSRTSAVYMPVIEAPTTVAPPLMSFTVPPLLMVPLVQRASAKSSAGSGANTMTLRLQHCQRLRRARVMCV